MSKTVENSRNAVNIKDLRLKYGNIEVQKLLRQKRQVRIALKTF